VLSLESEDTLLNFGRYTERMLEDRMRAILESSFSECPVSPENLVSRLFTDAELATDVSNPSVAIEAS
jgi:hypothetical protein